MHVSLWFSTVVQKASLLRKREWALRLRPQPVIVRTSNVSKKYVQNCPDCPKIRCPQCPLQCFNVRTCVLDISRLAFYICLKSVRELGTVL
jgi:hypothetical protein